MSGIKSYTAMQILDNAWTSVANTVWKNKAIEAIIIAEQEAEERHQQRLHGVHNMYKKMISEYESVVNSDNYHNEENHKIELYELRKRAVEAFCYSMQKGVSSCDRNKERGCTMACQAYLNFNNKLNENQ